MIKKCLGLIVGLLLLTGCSQLATLSVLGSTASFAVSNNTFSKIYSSTDVLTFMATDKDIKTHVYETVTTVKKKVNETFTLEKPGMLTEEKRVLVAVPVIKVEVSEIFKPDNNLVLASTLTYPIEDKIWTTKEWDAYCFLLTVFIISILLFLSSVIYLVIYIITSQLEIKIIIKKRNLKGIEIITTKKKKRRKN
jgi:uncharacterized membrane protein